MSVEISSTSTVPVSHLELLTLSLDEKNVIEGVVLCTKDTNDGHWDLVSPFALIVDFEDDDFRLQCVGRNPFAAMQGFSDQICAMDSDLVASGGDCGFLLHADKTAVFIYDADAMTVWRKSSEEKLLEFSFDEDRRFFPIPKPLMDKAIAKLKSLDFEIKDFDAGLLEAGQ